MDYGIHGDKYMSELFVNKIQSHTDANNHIEVASGHVLYAPGHVIQTVHHTSGDGTELTTTGNTYVSGGDEMTITITPKSSSSKILVMMNFNADTASTNSRAMYTIYRKIGSGSYSNLISTNTQNYDALVRIHEIGERILVNQTMHYYDSPATTSAVSYRAYFKNQNSGETARIRNDVTPSQLIAMEIAA